jgi:dihydrofolate synthase/folylpolyglutamate synthase
MDYYEAMSFITNTYTFGTKAGLERIQRLLELLGNPHKSLKFVHIAGTNGKGSVSAYMTSMLMEAGYKTGLFISPYLQRFTERIRINKTEIDDDSLTRHILNIKDKIGIMESEVNDHPTQFEILTALSLLHYAENKCDIVVFETGMGGIVDSTNVIDDIDSLVSIITTIGFDHMQYLGNTITEIAEKKAGIIKRNGSVALYPQTDEAMAVFEKTCIEKNASLYKLNYSDVNILEETIDGTTFDFGEYKGLNIKLLGGHQPYNAALSVIAANILNHKGYKISEDNIRQGLMKTRWPGRFEIVNPDPTVIIDGAHNVEAAVVLSTGLKTYFTDKKIMFITGVLADKQYEQMYAPFIPIAKEFFTITPDNPRALTANELKDYLSQFHSKVTACDSVIDALEKALKKADKDDVIVAFGSLYFIGLVRDYFGIFD